MKYVLVISIIAAGIVGILIYYIVNRLVDKYRYKMSSSGRALRLWASEASKQMDDIAEYENNMPLWIRVPLWTLFGIGSIAGYIYFKTIPSAVMTGALIYLLPEYFIVVRIARTKTKLEEQLGKAVRIFASEYKDTPNTVRALHAAAEKIDKPLGKILKETAIALDSGVSKESVVKRLGDRINTPYGKLFAQLVLQSFDDTAVLKMLVKFSSRLIVFQEQQQRSIQESKADSVLIVVLLIMSPMMFAAVTNFIPQAHEFFTGALMGRTIIFLQLSVAVGFLLLNKMLMGGGRID